LSVLERSEPARREVERYYDGRVAEKLRDFTGRLPRIEAAVETIADWAPAAPRRVLEIGCGVGATSWRMARAWPDAEVVGVDLSAGSIAVANTCFQRPNLRYRAGQLAECDLAGAFDLIVMMDVYEHIARSERSSVHAMLRRLLSPESRLLLMVPTPAHQDFLRTNDPAGLQPVDEDIHPHDIQRLASDVGARLLAYREIGVWRYGDYFHAVLGKTRVMADVALRQPKLSRFEALRLTAKRLLGRAPPAAEALSDYLGPDLLRPATRKSASRFGVSTAERRRLAAAWTAKTKGADA
jgi:trans-aconitate methyltransferase